jgi:integrase
MRKEPGTLVASTGNAPAAQTRSGAGTEERSFDARPTLPGEVSEMSAFAPIGDHPGYYRRGGRVFFRIRDRRGRRRWESGATIKEAQRLKAELEVDVCRGDFRDRSRERFADYARSWIETYGGRTGRGLSESTRDDYRRRLEQNAIPFFGRMRLSEIEPRDLKEYVAQLERPSPEHPKGFKPNTVRLAVAPVRVLLATAVEEGILRSNPAAGLRIAQRRAEGEGEEVEQVKAMSETEVAALLAQIGARAQRWLLFFTFLAWSGMRIGELIELRWKDVDLGQRVVHVRRRSFDGRVGPPKSKYGRRRLRLTPDLARALWRLQGEASTEEDDLVFATRAGGRVAPSTLMRRVLKPAAVEAGLGEWVGEGRDRRAQSWVGFHTFRHSCASILFRHGWNAAQVQRWLGHHSPAFTLATYVHLLPEDIPEPDFFDALAPAGCDPDVTQVGLDGPRSAEAVGA